MSDHTIALVSMLVEVGILIFMLWENYGPPVRSDPVNAWAAGHHGLWSGLWNNRTIVVAVAGLGIVVWLNLRPLHETPNLEEWSDAANTEIDRQLKAAKLFRESDVKKLLANSEIGLKAAQRELTIDKRRLHELAFFGSFDDSWPIKECQNVVAQGASLIIAFNQIGEKTVNFLAVQSLTRELRGFQQMAGRCAAETSAWRDKYKDDPLIESFIGQAPTTVNVVANAAGIIGKKLLLHQTGGHEFAIDAVTEVDGFKDAVGGLNALLKSLRRHASETLARIDADTEKNP